MMTKKGLWGFLVDGIINNYFKSQDIKTIWIEDSKGHTLLGGTVEEVHTVLSCGVISDSNVIGYSIEKTYYHAYMNIIVDVNIEVDDEKNE